MKKNKQLAIGMILGLLVAASIAMAVVFSGSGTLTVIETISVTTQSLDVELQPNLSVSRDIDLFNDGLADVDVQVAMQIEDPGEAGPGADGLYDGVTVTDPVIVTVPAGGGATASFTVTASNGVQPGDGLVTVLVQRP